MEQLANQMSKDAGINWMYEGAKGNAHREDYLLGKKIDKNFEKYSDVVNTQKAEAIDTIVSNRTVFNSGQSTGLKTSSLQKDIIKSEDPFVAVRVREETKRRELMDNPLMKARLQNMLKSMMTSKNEKKKEKKSKKEKKKKHKRSRSSSSSSSDDEPSKRKRSSSPQRKRRISEKSEESRSVRRKDSGDDRRKDRERRLSRSRSVERKRSPIRKRSRSRSTERYRSSQNRRRSRSRSAERAPRRRQDSRSSPKRSRDEDKADDRKHRRKSRSRSRSADKPSSSRQFDSHVPRHLQKSRSSSESESDHERRRRDDDKEDSRKKSYGLVEMRKRTSEEREVAERAPTKEYKLIKIPTGRGDNASKKREPRKVLTEEEKAARLAEMQANVKWRDEVRENNVARGRVEDEEEKEEADRNGYAPSFIRNQMRDACDDMTMEKRLQSNKRGVQRSHGYMDRSFAKK